MTECGPDEGYKVMEEKHRIIGVINYGYTTRISDRGPLALAQKMAEALCFYCFEEEHRLFEIEYAEDVPNDVTFEELGVLWEGGRILVDNKFSKKAREVFGTNGSVCFDFGYAESLVYTVAQKVLNDYCKVFSISKVETHYCGKKSNCPTKIIYVELDTESG